MKSALPKNFQSLVNGEERKLHYRDGKMLQKQKNDDDQKKRRSSLWAYKHPIHAKTLLAGKWHIIEMSGWDKEVIDEDVKAYISIQKNGSGEFRFCYVNGDDVNGEFKNSPYGAVFDFTFIGSDECDETSGDGWLRTIDGKIAEGQIRFHNGDKSGFRARKIITKEKNAIREAKK